MSTIPSKDLGTTDLSGIRDVYIQHDARVSHNMHVGHDLDVQGWLEAKNIIAKNIYLSGKITDLDYETNLDITFDTSTGDTYIRSGETLVLSAAVHRAWEDLSDQVEQWTITRDSGDPSADAIWNANHTDFNGTIVLTQSDIGATELNVNAIFTVVATSSEWSVGRSIAIHTLYLQSALSMRFVSEYGAQDTFITYGDKVKFQAVIEDGLKNDYTEAYDQWSIRRHNGDSADDVASDGVWNATRAAISSTGEFYIEWSAEHDDLQAERATFVVTAQQGSAMATRVSGTLSI